MEEEISGIDAIQGIYIALFGRPADPAGLLFYVNATNGGQNLAAIGNLSGQEEYLSRFPNPTDRSAVITKIYQNLFERTPSTDEVAEWLEIWEEQGATINDIAIRIQQSALGDDLETIRAKIDAANLFLERLDTEREQTAYDGDFAESVGRDYIDAVDGADDPATVAEADTAILRLFPDEGQGPGGNPGGGGDDGLVLSGEGPVFLYNGTTKLGEYPDMDRFPGEEMPQTRVMAEETSIWDDAYVGDVVILKGIETIQENMRNIVEWYQPSWQQNTTFRAADAVETGPDLSWLADYKPANLYLNTPSFGDHPSSMPSEGLLEGWPISNTDMVGTRDNDVMVFVETNPFFSHTATGNGGQDIIVSATLPSAFLESTEPGDDTDLSVANFPAIDVLVEEEGEPTFSHDLDGGADNDVILSLGGFENSLKGGTGNDIVISLAKAQDFIEGGAGDDIIFGGNDGMREIFALEVELPDDGEPAELTPFDFGGDTLTGNAGSDRFAYAQESQLDATPMRQFMGMSEQDLFSAGFDTITDFESGMDKITVLMANEPTGETGYVVDFTNNTDGDISFEIDSYALARATAEQNFQLGATAGTGADLRAYFANVDGDGFNYLFIDDDADGTLDFQIRLAEDDVVTKADLELLDIDDVFAEIGAIGTLPIGGFPIGGFSTGI